MTWPRRLALASAFLVTTALAAGLCLLRPLRPQGADTVPGRMGALTLACAGSFDLATADWIAAAPRDQPLPFYLYRNGRGEVVSPWGPGPALWGAPAMLTLQQGALVRDVDLLRRARAAAALAVGLAAGLLALALAAQRPLWLAIAGGLAAALSCAGAVSLGQGLWQQTASLPLLLAAVAALAWGEERPAWRVAVWPALALAVALRPPLAGLAAGLALVALPGLRRKAGGPGVIVAAGLAVGALLPVAGWNLRYYGSPLPLGLVHANRLLSQVLLGGRSLLTLAPGPLLARSLAALASPARGLLWWAPVALFAGSRALLAPTGRLRTIGLGLVLQGFSIVAFFNWWGGISFGPRLFAEVVWVAIWLLLGPLAAAAAAGARAPRRGAWRRWVPRLALAWTVGVGLLGLLRYDARAWELRREPIHDPTAVWDFADNPLSALLVRRDLGPEVFDAPPGPFRYCAPRPWTDLPPAR